MSEQQFKDREELRRYTRNGDPRQILQALKDGVDVTDMPEGDSELFCAWDNAQDALGELEHYVRKIVKLLEEGADDE